VEILGQGEIQYAKPWPAERVSDFISESERPTRRRVGESGGVKPFVGIWTADVGGGYNVGEPVTAVIYVTAGGGSAHTAAGNLGILVRSIHHRKGISALRDECSRNSPSADYLVHYRIAVQVIFPLAER